MSSSAPPPELCHFGNWLINNRLNILDLLTLGSVTLIASAVRELVETGIHRSCRLPEQKYSGRGHKLGMTTDISTE